MSCEMSLESIDEHRTGRRRTALASPFVLRASGPAACLSRGGEDADGLAAALGTERDGTGGQGEQRVVATPADQVTRVELGTALTKDDLAGLDLLATVTLDTQALGRGVATVPGAGRTLFVCHR
jgi:hypothetical protein